LSGNGILQLDQEELAGIIVLFARGYTVRYIERRLIERAAEKGRPDLVPNQQQLMTLAVRYGDDIDQIREDMEKQLLTTGLARKGERVRRLSEMAENIEQVALRPPSAEAPLNLDAIEQYRKLVKDIHGEIEPLNIKFIAPDDPWALLLNRLKEERDFSNPNLLPTSDQSTPRSDEGQPDPKSMPS
jgi:hypothetical protein